MRHRAGTARAVLLILPASCAVLLAAALNVDAGWITETTDLPAPPGDAVAIVLPSEFLLSAPAVVGDSSGSPAGETPSAVPTSPGQGLALDWLVDHLMSPTGHPASPGGPFDVGPPGFNWSPHNQTAGAPRGSSGGNGLQGSPVLASVPEPFEVGNSFAPPELPPFQVDDVALVEDLPPAPLLSEPADPDPPAVVSDPPPEDLPPVPPTPPQAPPQLPDPPADPPPTQLTADVPAPPIYNNPEPASLTLLGLGTALAGGFSLRKRRACGRA